MPFSVRWVIHNSNANIHEKNKANKRNAIFFSMQAYAENLQIAQNYQESEYDQRHSIRELIDQSWG